MPLFFPVMSLTWQLSLAAPDCKSWMASGKCFGFRGEVLLSWLRIQDCAMQCNGDHTAHPHGDALNLFGDSSCWNWNWKTHLIYSIHKNYIDISINIELWFNTWNAHCKKITAGIKASPSIGSDRHGLTVAMFGPTRWVTFVTTFTLGQCDGFVSDTGDTCNPYRGVKKIKFLGWLTSCGKCCI